MKIYANYNQDSDKIQKLYDIQDDMVSLLEENHISDVEPYGVKIYKEIPEIGIIDIYVCGDWKHDLLRSEYLIKENFNILKYESEELEDTGSDWGPELYHYYVYISSYM